MLHLTDTVRQFQQQYLDLQWLLSPIWPPHARSAAPDPVHITTAADDRYTPTSYDHSNVGSDEEGSDSDLTLQVNNAFCLTSTDDRDDTGFRLFQSDSEMANATLL